MKREFASAISSVRCNSKYRHLLMGNLNFCYDIIEMQKVSINMKYIKIIMYTYQLYLLYI